MLAAFAAAAHSLAETYATGTQQQGTAWALAGQVNKQCVMGHEWHYIAISFHAQKWWASNRQGGNLVEPVRLPVDFPVGS